MRRLTPDVGREKLRAMTEKKSEQPAKKTLSEDDLVVTRKHRAGSVGSVGAQPPGAKKINDPGGKRGHVGDPDA